MKQDKPFSVDGMTTVTTIGVNARQIIIARKNPGTYGGRIIVDTIYASSNSDQAMVYVYRKTPQFDTIGNVIGDAVLLFSFNAGREMTREGNRLFVGELNENITMFLDIPVGSTDPANSPIGVLTFAGRIEYEELVKRLPSTRARAMPGKGMRPPVSKPGVSIPGIKRVARQVPIRQGIANIVDKVRKKWGL